MVSEKKNNRPDIFISGRILQSNSLNAYQNGKTSNRCAKHKRRTSFTSNALFL
jgi:hypothetical protein